LEKGYVDDVSRLNKTSIHSIIKVSANKDTALTQLVDVLTYARKNKLPLSIAGARHSMGGHTIAPQGIVIDMLPFNKMSLDTNTHILSVGAGALWSEIIPYLNTYGRAVAVIQSDNAFSVGGSISVNCHGWQHNNAPIASSVVSFRLLKADGTLIKCSRTENKTLFSLALGGYGLLGIILEVDLQTVPNEIYTYHRVLMSSDKYIDYYKKYIDENEKARMVYGRLNVNKGRFSTEGKSKLF
jgi:FAD/FMN-containing dehydrogenase